MKTVTSIKLDKQVKEEAGKLASRMGLNLSSVVNATLKRFVMERRVVFSLAPEFQEDIAKAATKNSEEIFDGVTNLCSRSVSLLLEQPCARRRVQRHSQF